MGPVLFPLLPAWGQPLIPIPLPTKHCIVSLQTETKMLLHISVVNPGKTNATESTDSELPVAGSLTSVMGLGPQRRLGPGHNRVITCDFR